LSKFAAGTWILQPCRPKPQSLDTINCSGGDCATPPLGVDIDGASLSASSPQATYFYAQDLGRDMVMLVDINGVAVERYRYETYGHRTIAEPGAGDVCNDADDRTCQSRFGNPLGHAGAMRSPITGVYEMRARLYAPAMRVFLSTDPLGYVDAFDRWLYVAGDPFGFVDPFGLAAAAPNSSRRSFRTLGPGGNRSATTATSRRRQGTRS
jgi:RHS repeat-associated protein